MSKGVKFLFDNYADLDLLANYFVSSEQSAFPIENAFNLNRRSKVWRSNGYYRITPLNSDLIFRETVGVDLTASVVADEYNSTSDFLAAIKAALEDAGASTYTVTQTADKKISITSNGLGGGGIFQIRGDDVLSTLAPVMGYDAAAYTGALTYTADLIRIATSEWLVLDCGIASKPNAFAMTASKITGLKFSQNSMIVLKGNPTNPFDWSTPAFTQVITPDDEVMSYITDDDFTDVGYRYWRIEFMDIDNAYGYIEAGAFFLGRWWAPSAGCAEFPLDLKFLDRTDTIISEGGQTFSDRKPIVGLFGLQFNFLDVTDSEDADYYFNKFGIGLPFFVALDTTLAFTSTVNRGVKYCKFDQAISRQLHHANKFSMPVALREEL